MQRPPLNSRFTSDINQSVVLNHEYLADRTRWIRDDLDPQIAREGPDVLSPDMVITLVTFFEELRRASIPAELLQSSRVHLALSMISGRATRWPSKLIDKVDHIVNHWQAMYGPLTNIRPLLYEEGGRLYSISTPDDIEREKLLIKWIRAPGIHTSPSVSRHHGHLGFKPGDWWISPMFAYRAGIIDSGDPAGGITCDTHGAYALVMTQDEELSGPSPNSLVYRSKPSDIGRYRLTSADVDSRQPIRVLRSHTLRSFWTPRAGVRYDGLFSVRGWAVTYDDKRKQWNYDVTLTRIIEDQVSMKEVLRKPNAEEMDDYYEYKRIRREVKLSRNNLTRAKPLIKMVDTGLVTQHPEQPVQAHVLRQHQRHEHHPGSPVSPSSLASYRGVDDRDVNTTLGLPKE